MMSDLPLICGSQSPFKQDSLGAGKTTLQTKRAPDSFHSNDACVARLEDRRENPHPHWVSRLLSRVCGHRFMRRLSNFFSHFLRLPEIYRAQRDYPVLLPETALYTSKNEPLKIDNICMTAELLAQKFQPKLSSISSARLEDARFRPTAMRYEVLPPNQGKDHYSIIYYVSSAELGFPFPFVNLVYRLIKPVLFGSGNEWHAIQVDVNRNTGSLEGLAFETTNYTSDPYSYGIYNPSDLQLVTKVQKTRNGWEEQIYQTNGRSMGYQTHPMPNNGVLELAYISWTGGFDLVQTAQNKGLVTIALPNPSLEPLDARTYQNEGFDLRTPWLERRKEGCALKFFANRKAHPVAERKSLLDANV